MTPRLGHFLARNWPLLMHCQWRVWHPPSQEECLVGSWHVSRRMTARVTITGQNMGKALCTTRHENAGIELTDVHSCCIITSVMVWYVWATLPESLVWLMTSSSAYTDRKCMEVMVVFIHPLVRPGCKNVLKRESWGGALILLDLKQSSAGAALTYKSLLEKMASHDAGDGVQLRHLTTERCCLTHSEGSVLTDGQPRAQWQRDIRWLSCGRIVSREFRVMTSLSFKSLSFICPPPPQALFSLFSKGLEAASFLWQRFIAPDTEECRLLVSHTQNQQTTLEEPLQSLKDNFLILASLFLIFFSSRERERDSSAALSCPQVRYDKFVHFICDLSGHLELLGFIVIVKRPVNTV